MQPTYAPGPGFKTYGPALSRSRLRAAALFFGMLALAVLAILLPAIVHGQDAAPLGEGQDVGAILTMILAAIRGGDWQGGILAGILGLVWVLRTASKRIPRLGAFLATDEGGALLLVLTGLPVALLAAKAGGAALTWSLVGKALIATLGAGGGWSVGRKLLRLVTPLVAKIPRVGPMLAGLLDVVSGAKAKVEIKAETEAAYRRLEPAPDAAAAAALLSRPPVP